MSAWVPALLLGAAAAVAGKPRCVPSPTQRGPTTARGGWLHRYRSLWAALAGVGAWLFVGGWAGVVGGVAATAGCWVLIQRAEPGDVRARREAVRRDLPVLVQLLASALAAGSAPGEALVTVVDALPGPGADELAPLVARLRLGADPADAWHALAAVPSLAPLGRTLARAHATGAPVATAVERLADELARSARAEAEEQARRVGVKAAVPLGLCLLPAFLLIGIVPMVGGLLGGLGL